MASMRTADDPPSSFSARRAAASMTCSQLSSTINIRCDCRNCMMYGSGSEATVVNPRAAASAPENEPRRGHGAQVDETHAVRVGVAGEIGSRAGHGGLAHPSRAHDGHQAPLSKLIGDRGHHVLATDQAGRRRLGLACSVAGRRTGCIAGASDRRNKAITVSGDILDIADAVAVLPEYLAQRGDMNPQRAFLDNRSPARRA